MHELTLVDGIIREVEAEAEAKGGRVTSFTVLVGELAQFDIGLIRELIGDLTRGTPFEKTRVRVQVERARVRCLGCGSVWTSKDVAGTLSRTEKEAVHFIPELLGSYFHCPTCSKSYFEIEEGRSVRIAEVRVSDR